MQFEITHTSEITGSTWEFIMNDECQIVKAFLNGTRVRLAGKREEIAYNYINKNYSITNTQHEAAY